MTMRAHPLVFAVLFAALTAALLAAPGHGELPQSWPICKGDDLDANPEQRIKSCTAIIESPQETQERRAGAYFYRALAWRVLDDLQRAIADFTEAIRLNPRYASAYGWRGQLLVETGEQDRAVANYTDALKVFPDDDGYLGYRGFAHFHRADFPASVADLHRAIELVPYSIHNEDRAPMLYLARARAGQYGTADLEAQVERLKSMNAKIPLIFDLYLLRSSPEAVLAAGKESLRAQCEANFYVGQWHILRNDRDEARRLLQLASAKRCDGFHPTHPGAVAELKRMAP
jgi:tetratricopeptide (TPR) repeat protein